MQVNQCRAVIHLERADHFEWRPRFTHCERRAVRSSGYLEIQAQPPVDARNHSLGQLINNRVESAGWRCEPTSIMGVNAAISSSGADSLYTASTIAGLRFHRIWLAAVCPSGSRRWQADTSPLTVCCKYASATRLTS